MWKLAPLILTIFLLSSCNDHQVRSKPALPATSGKTGSLPDTVTVDSVALIMNLTKQVLSVIKAKDYTTLGSFFHPVAGTRFSHYGHIDTINDRKFTATQFLEQLGNSGKLNWGNYDGSGEEIFLTVDHYFKRFVYNADFLHAEKTSLNKMIGKGNSLNNLEAVYKDRDFTESYFAGFDKQLEGMDWSSLRLVFESYKDKVYLVAIIHDQWTI